MSRPITIVAFSLCAISCAWIATTPIPAANPLSPEAAPVATPELARVAEKPAPVTEAAGRMKVPAGFKVTLFAGEPDVVQPIAFTFDERGRMWVVECVMYPKWSQDGKGGRDRVIILEDTDGDGIHDKRTVVLSDGVNLSGIELGFGGMYMCASPNLLFVPIKDDKPSGPPVVLLDGWNTKDTKHNVFNSLMWGPEGWLYGCNGIQAKANIGKPGTPEKERVYFDCGVWRYHPTHGKFEVVANGTTNPWGLDWDEMGEMFITNCVIDHLWHMVPGGHYTRMYGQDPNPYVYDYMTSCVDYKHWAGGPWTESRADQKTGALKKEHDDAGGGHAHSGAAIYLGDNFPKEYRNTLFTCNIHGNRLNNDGLERTANGMKGVRRPDFQFANDPWFRGICVKQGPDGGLYVSDWTDTGECHNYVEADTTNGRIYRTIYGNQKTWKGNIATMTDADLVKAVISKNEWLARMARLQLQQRGVKDNASAAKNAAALLAQFDAVTTPAEKIRCAWAIASLDQLAANSRVVKTLIESKDVSLRAWGIRLALEYNIAEAIQQIAAMKPFATEQSGFVRQHLYSALTRVSNSVFTQIRNGSLSDKLIEETDPNLSLLRWYAFERTMSAADTNFLTGFDSAGSSLVRQNITRRTLQSPDKANIVVAHAVELVAKKQDGQLLDLLQGMHLAYADRRDVPQPSAWSKLDFSAQPEGVKRIAEELSVKFGDKKTIELMRSRISSTTANPTDRRRAIEILAARKMPEIVEALRLALNDATVRSVAMRGLANYPDDANAQAILQAYPQLTADEKVDAIQTLASRKSFALLLLAAIEKGAVPKTDINAFTARQIQALKDKTVDAQLTKVWGTIRPASATRVAQTQKLKSLLTASTLEKANKHNGRQLFAKNCATCHKLFGEGGDVGPELTGSQRASLDYVLENVLDPSAVVANEYRLTTFNLIDGRVVSGIIRKTTGQALTIRTLNEEVTVLTKDIESQKGTTLSIMPDGLFDGLRDDEIRDLVAYLASTNQVPLK